MLQGIFSQFMQLLAEKIPGLKSMRLARLLPVESWHHDDSRGAKGSGGIDYLAHRRIERLFHGRIFGQNKAVKACADGRYLYVSVLKRVLEFCDSVPESSSARLEPDDTQAL